MDVDIFYEHFSKQYSDIVYYVMVYQIIPFGTNLVWCYYPLPD